MSRKIQKCHKWLENYAKDSSLWANQETYILPVLLDNEYRRMNELVKDGNVYGVFLELKDVLELTVKLPVVFSVALMVNGKADDSSNTSIYEILKLMLQKELSFGDWFALVRNLIAQDYTNDSCKRILENVYTVFFEKGKFSRYPNIVNWRNIRIGHGALILENDSSFQKEFEELLKKLKIHFEYASEFYKDLNIKFIDDSNGVAIMAQDIENWDNISIRIGENYVRTDPFLLNFNNRVYLFDSFLSSKNMKSAYLDYYGADKVNIFVQKLEKLYLDASKHISMDNSAKTINSKAFFRQDEQAFFDNESKNRLIKPLYLKDWIECKIRNYNKGVFLLKMDSGMGKTTFVKMLDPFLSYPKMEFENVSVRAYYIHSEITKAFSYFKKELERKLTFDDNKQEVACLPFNGEYNDLAALVNYYKEIHEEFSYDFEVKEKLLIVIDGIDESFTDGASDIFNSIPLAEELRDGVFFLITCRNEENTIVDDSAFTDVLYVDSKSKDNEKVVSEYLKQCLQNADEDTLAASYSLVDNSIFRASILRYIPEYIPYYNIISSEEICILFFNKLKFIYTDKYFSRVKKILAILALSPIPLSLKNILFLLGEEIESFQYYCIFQDIAPVLNRITEDGETYFEISHDIYRRVVLSVYDEDLEKVQLALLNSWLDITENGGKLSYNDLLIAVFVFENTNRILPDLNDELCTEKVLKNGLIAIIETISYFDLSNKYLAYLYLEIANQYMLYLNCFRIITERDFNLDDIQVCTYVLIDAAAFLSGNYDYAKELLAELQKELPEICVAQSNKQLISTCTKGIKVLEEYSKKIISTSIITYNNARYIKKCSDMRDKKYSTIFNDYKMDIFISEHNIFNGPRECVMALLAGCIKYFNKTSDTAISTSMIRKIIGLISSVTQEQMESKDGYRNLFYSEFIKNLLWCYGFDKDNVNNVVKNASLCTKEKFFNTLERKLILSWCDLNKRGPNTLGHNLTKTRINPLNFEIETIEYNFIEKNIYVAQFVQLYRMLKSGDLGFCKKISASSHIYQCKDDTVLGIKMSEDKNSIEFPSNCWTAFCESVEFKQLCTFYALKESTLVLVKQLLDSNVVYNAYHKKTNMYADITIERIVDKDVNKLSVDQNLLSEIYWSILGEYKDLSFVVDGDENVEIIIKGLYLKQYISSKHYQAFLEFLNIGDNISNGEPMVIKETMLDILFNKKLLYWTDKVVERVKIIRNVGYILRDDQKLNNVLQCSKILDGSLTYVDLELLLRSGRM